MTASSAPMSLVLDRLRLLRLLAYRPWAAGLLVAGNAVTAVIPTAMAAASGWLVALLTEQTKGAASTAAVVPALVLISALLAMDEIVVAALRAGQDYVAGQIDGAVRREVRALAMAPAYSEHLEDPAFADNASRASDIGQDRVRSPGTAATGQLVLVFRMVSALIATWYVCRFSVPLGIGLLVVSLTGRAIVRRQWIGLSALGDTREWARRRLEYWTDLATEPAAGKEIRLFGLGAWVVRRRTQAARDWLEPLWEAALTVLRRQGPTVSLAYLAAAAALVVPGLAALNGRLETSQLVSVFVAAWGVMRIAAMGHEAFDIEYGLGAVRAFDRIREEFPAPAPAPAPRPAGSLPSRPSGGTALRIEELGFSYPGATRPALSGIDLRLESGQVLAVVGHNGAGKTTLIKVLAGLYRPTEGRLVADDRVIDETTVREWRQRVAVLFQDFNRYPMTARQNITLAAPEYAGDAAGVEQAVRRAGAQSLIDDLPNGLETVLGRQWANGSELSGGQWQRVAIARAVFAAHHGRRFVVLDEPTAHLDVEAETQFYQEVIGAVAGVATVILISHRLSTTRAADRIVLLERGRIREDGDHESLLRAGGRYAELFTLQAAQFAATAGEKSGDGR
ncbi:ABC transporter ATP-binding protein/permease [Kribbella sp. NBC_01505]|uniref:ABC transporter ATP-binding protein n=1 Tax=Kribbella sp. NBC_01505 TaxID=2903580 RepID=UPI00386F8FAB